MMASTLFHKHYPPASPAFRLLVETQVRAALEEDIGEGDLTAALLPENQTAKADIVCREYAVICGIPWATECFSLLDTSIKIQWLVHEGEEILPGQILCHMQGMTRALLTAERCALNFLQTLSATATETRKYVKLVQGTKAEILDTRKTIPHMRLAQKYAVTIGGGKNQRLALYDGILIKENHIASAGSIEKVLKAAQQKNTDVQIEVENLSQLQQAIEAGAKSILLDNFDLNGMTQAVKLTNGRAILEVSGGVNLATVSAIAETGVDRISIGGLTKNINAIDLSMRITAIGVG